MLYLTSTAAVIVGVVSLTVVSLEWPRTDQGWTLLAASTGLYVLATTLLFAAVKMIGPLRTAAIDNTTPVWSVLFGLWLIGETLAPRQLLGIALVVGALIVLQFLQRPRRPMHG